ncbi:hypothetical protein H4S02_007528 [Coemansia sp. RSA 2611]|nr:hypothetical protein H4S02_007528 [Coemansia sp. RSA 2611]
MDSASTSTTHSLPRRLATALRAKLSPARTRLRLEPTPSHRSSVTLNAPADRPKSERTKTRSNYEARVTAALMK